MSLLIGFILGTFLGGMVLNAFGGLTGKKG